MRAPDFWRSDNGIARLLEPFGLIVGAVTARRMARAKPYHAAAPVICVGNLTVGGTGKTPVAASIAAILEDRGRTPAILMRGYGGTLAGPVKVSAHIHGPDDVGDEALLHARTTPTWVARNRALAAPLAIAGGADVLVMDDGHQHATLAKTLSLIVVDGRYGFGNGRIMPAGPLRESIPAGLARAHAVVVMGDDAHDLAERLKGRIPVLKAHLVPGPEWGWLRGQKVVAFAGIGDPFKFFDAVAAMGARIVAVHPFDDHYDYGVADIQPILDEAFSVGAIPVTTAKDAVRLPADQRQQVNVLNIAVEWEDQPALERLLDEALATRH
jgi:tetraacyldisaccharide 4'-kinase